MVSLQHDALIRYFRISHFDLQQKAVELRLRQRVRPFKFHRILRRENREEIVERMPLTIRRHLPLLHRLKQRRLRARRHAVDLICQQKLREHRTLVKRELSRLRRKHTRAQDVRRHHVRRTLHASELYSQEPRQRLHCERLRYTRHALHQRMATAQHCQQRLGNCLLLPGDDASDLLLSARKQFVCCRYSFTHSLLLTNAMFKNHSRDSYGTSITRASAASSAANLLCILRQRTRDRQRLTKRWTLLRCIIRFFEMQSHGCPVSAQPCLQRAHDRLRSFINHPLRNAGIAHENAQQSSSRCVRRCNRCARLLVQIT